MNNMKIIVSNDIRIVNPTHSIIAYCDNSLTLPNPDYIMANRMGRWVGKMEKSIKLYSKVGDELILPFGTLKNVWKLAFGADFENKIHDFIGNNLVGNIKLYDYQENALNDLKSGKNGVLEAPCGSGKTQIGLALIKSIGGRALWITHTKKLLEQSMDRAKQYYKGDFGTITEGKVSIGKDITFATIQTMSNIDTEIYKNAFDIVVVDEAHHCVGSPTKVMQFYKVITNINARYKYGLSATLSRSDNLISCVYAILGVKLHTITQSEVGNKIIKAEHKRIEFDKQYNVLDYSNYDGTLDYAKLLTMLSDDNDRNNFIVSKIVELNKMGKKQLVLCSRLSQIDKLYDKLNEYNVSKITGKVKEKDRNYENCDIILATYSLAKEGLDIVKLDVVHFSTPQKDQAIVKQSAGRVERNYEGKKTPMIYDYVDTDISYCEVCYKKRKNILK